jgi:hypothetical protein
VTAIWQRNGFGNTVQIQDPAPLLIVVVFEAKAESPTTAVTVDGQALTQVNITQPSTSPAFTDRYSLWTLANAPTGTLVIETQPVQRAVNFAVYSDAMVRAVETEEASNVLEFTFNTPVETDHPFYQITFSTAIIRGASHEADREDGDRPYNLPGWKAENGRIYEPVGIGVSGNSDIGGGGSLFWYNERFSWWALKYIEWIERANTGTNVNFVADDPFTFAPGGSQSIVHRVRDGEPAASFFGIRVVLEDAFPAGMVPQPCGSLYLEADRVTKFTAANPVPASAPIAGYIVRDWSTDDPQPRPRWGHLDTDTLGQPLWRAAGGGDPARFDFNAHDQSLVATTQWAMQQTQLEDVLDLSDPMASAWALFMVLRVRALPAPPARVEFFGDGQRWGLAFVTSPPGTAPPGTPAIVTLPQCVELRVRGTGGMTQQVRVPIMLGEWFTLSAWQDATHIALQINDAQFASADAVPIDPGAAANAVVLGNGDTEAEFDCALLQVCRSELDCPDSRTHGGEIRTKYGI